MSLVSPGAFIGEPLADLKGITAGSILYVTSTLAVGEDNANLFWDATNKRVGVKTATPIDAISVVGNIDVMALAGDANPTAQLTGEAVKFGAGGASAVDVQVVRIDSATVAVQLVSGTDTTFRCKDIRFANLAQIAPLGSGNAIGINPTNVALIVGSLGTILCPVKSTAGALTDALAGNTDGAIAANSNEKRIYIRVGSVWQFIASFTGTVAGFVNPLIRGLDNRTGLTVVDGAATTLYTTTAGGQLYKLIGRIFITTLGAGGAATYTLKWTEGGVVNTKTLTASAVDTDVDLNSILIQPDNATAITAQLTAISGAGTTVNVAATVEQMA